MRVPLETIINFHKAPSLYQFSNPGDGRYDYPSNRRRTKDNVDQMRKAEANLVAFWKKIDFYFKTNKGVSQHQILIQKSFSTFRYLGRTPEWVEPIVVPKPERVAGTLAVYQPFSSLRFVDKSGKNNLFSTPKPKSKTRGLASSTSTAAELTTEVAEDKQPTFTLNRRAYKTFSTIFHN